MENGMKRKTKWEFRRKTKYVIYVDTTAYKGKQFEIKQNLDFKSDFSKENINFQYFDLTHAHNPSVFKGFIKLEGKIRHLRNTNDSCEFEKKMWVNLKTTSLTEAKSQMKEIYISFTARIYGLHLLENFRPTVANKSKLEVCLYFFPIDKHV